MASLTELGTLEISDNESLTSLEGLEGLQNVSWLEVTDNDALTTLDGLSGLASLGLVKIANNDALIDLNGMPDLTRFYSLGISDNDSLSSLNGISALNSVDYSLSIWDNDSLVDLNAISALTSVGGDLTVWGNVNLTNLDGLSSIQAVDNLFVRNNTALSDCLGILKLVDPIDDYEPGPGPGSSGIPDVAEISWVQNNGDGCSSANDILGEIPLYEINAGLNDAWFNFDTNGQGFLITVFPEIKQMFMAWFTYDTERPSEDITAILGEPGHRWLTAQGEYMDNVAELTLYVTAGGEFDSEEPEPVTEPYGELLLEFSTCNAGSVTYDLPSIYQQGTVPIERLTLDNVPLCYLLNSRSLNINSTDD